MKNMIQPSRRLYAVKNHCVLFFGIMAFFLTGHSATAEDVRSNLSSHLLNGNTPDSSASYLSTADPDNVKDMVRNLEYGPATAQQCLDHYGERIEKSAEAARLLGERFLTEKKFMEAQTWLNKSIEKKRNQENLTALAELYLAQGDEAKWLKTMEKRLDLPFNRKNDADTNHTIAAHFIQKGEWETALPYEEAAANRGYDWAYYQAAWLNAAMGNTQRGLELLEQETYHNTGFHTLATYILAFGAEPTAWTHKLLDFIYSQRSKGGDVDRNYCIRIALVREDHEDAVTLLEQSLRETNDPWYGVFAALVCEEQGWFNRRDQILVEATKRYPQLRNPSQNRKKVRAFINLYIEANSTKKLQPETKAQILRFYNTSGTRRGDFTHAFIGELFRLKGDPETAVKIFRKVISLQPTRYSSEYIAFRGLRLLGEDSGALLREQYPNPSRPANEAE
jgi:tetratricopeptide (TPR) repeat protein